MHESAMIKLKTAIVLMIIQLCALAVQLLGWIFEYLASQEPDVPVAGVVLVAAIEFGFVSMVTHLERRRTRAAICCFSDDDLAFLRTFNLVYCAFNPTACATMAFLEQTMQQFYLGLTATQMVTLVFIFLLMREDLRWLGVVAYSTLLQMLVCFLKEGVTLDIRSLVIISNIAAGHAFVLWSWRKEVLSNLNLQLRLQLKEHYYKELFEFFPDAIALYT